MANFYISDLHFGHEAIIRMDRRPFSDVKEMEDTIVTRWNERVQFRDKVYILGDFCTGGYKDWQRILRRLKGEKVLVLGNHDIKSPPTELRREFAGIHDYMEIEDNGRRVILCHYPLMFYKHAPNPNWYMLCGHVHVSAEYDCLEALKKDLRENRYPGIHNLAQIYNCGCMLPYMDYTPRTLDEIVQGSKV